MGMGLPIHILLITLVILFAASWNDGNGGVAGMKKSKNDLVDSNGNSLPKEEVGNSRPSIYGKHKRKWMNSTKSIQEHIHQIAGLIEEYTVKMAVTKKDDKFIAIMTGVRWWNFLWTKRDTNPIPMFEHTKNVMEVAIYYRDLLKAVQKTPGKEVEGLAPLQNIADRSNADNPKEQNAEIEHDAVDDRVKEIETDVEIQQAENERSKTTSHLRLKAPKLKDAQREVKINQDNIIREALDGRLTLEGIENEFKMEHSIANDAAKKLKEDIPRIKIEVIKRYLLVAGHMMNNLDAFTEAISKEKNPDIVEAFSTGLGHFATQYTTQIEENIKTVKAHQNKVPEAQQGQP